MVVLVLLYWKNISFKKNWTIFFNESTSSDAKSDVNCFDELTFGPQKIGEKTR